MVLPMLLLLASALALMVQALFAMGQWGWRYCVGDIGGAGGVGGVVVLVAAVAIGGVSIDGVGVDDCWRH